MHEILNTTNINEISDSMNFETELFKSKKVVGKEERKVKKTTTLEGLFKRFFHLKMIKPSIIDNKKQKKIKRIYEEERLKSWNEITKKESKEFHKMDRIAKYKLSKIIPNDLSKRRY